MSTRENIRLIARTPYAHLVNCSASKAVFMSRRSVHLTTLCPGQAWPSDYPVTDTTLLESADGGE